MCSRGRVAVGVTLLLLAACGSGVETPSNTGPRDKERPDWAMQVLEGDPGPDHPTQVGVDGDQVVITLVSDQGVIAGYSTDESGRFVAGTPAETGARFLALGGIARVGDRWLAVGSGGLRDDELVFEVRAYASPDGRSWSAADATGLEGPADVSGVAALGDGAVAVGTGRDAADPSQGGFRPVAWHSPDGATWTTVALPTDRATEGSVSGVAVVGEEVLAVGTVDGVGTIWSSVDGGATWTRAKGDGLTAMSSIGGIAAQGKELVITGVAPSGGEDGVGGAVLLRSADGGRTWEEAAEPPPLEGADSWLPVYAGGGRFFTLVSTFVEAWRNPEVCYADITLCQQDTSVVLYASDDGGRWSRVDTAGIGRGENGEVGLITGTGDGRVVAFTRVARGMASWTWPAGEPLPVAEEPAVPGSDVDILGENETPEPGHRYGAPLLIHCGMDWLQFGGKAWQRTDTGPDVETGAGDEIDPDWPVAQQTLFGFATLTRDGLVDYSIGDGTVIATYGPAKTKPPGCD